LISHAACNAHTTRDDIEVESSARLITSTASSLLIAEAKPASELITMVGKQRNDSLIPLPEDPRYASRNWRAEAWERERERETRGQDCRADPPRRRANGR